MEDAKMEIGTWSRALVVWLVLVVVESIHGTLRQMLIAPHLGDFRARQWGVLSGSILILLVAYFSAPWIAAKSRREQLLIGTAWVILMVIFEVSLGRALGFSFARIFADYDLRHGGFMGLGLLILLFSPMIAARLRRR
jgi:hypothetical protein